MSNDLRAAFVLPIPELDRDRRAHTPDGGL
jgi:hypothetical protein